MKNFTTKISVIGLLSVAAFAVQAQDRFTQEFEPVRQELTKWDPVRGEWLAGSLQAMANQKEIPVRTFPENLTPMEMMRMVPASSQEAIRNQVATSQKVATPETSAQWSSLNNLIDRTNCKPVMGRSYGDPHLSSFDGASYSFQTVGEFVMARSESGRFEVQARQQPQSDDFSLNTAVAMNVDGDRVCIYAGDKPDNIVSSALRVNGNPVQLSRDVYFLPHGGTIRYTNRTYLVTWPTGETASVELRNSSAMSFLNISLQVYPCSVDRVNGLLGNANGSSRDDFDAAGPNRPASLIFTSAGNDQAQRASNEAEKEYLAFLARDFARAWRITQETSLFDYRPGETTLTYTDERFPKVHHTIGDLSPDRHTAARRACEQEGIQGPDLNGCIYDRAYLDIPANPRPVVQDPTQGLVLTKVDRPIRNDNNGLTLGETAPVTRGNGQPEAQPLAKPDQTIQQKETTGKTDGTVTPQKGTGSTPTSNPIKINTGKGTSSSPSKGTSTPKPSGSSPVKTTPAIRPGKG